MRRRPPILAALVLFALTSIPLWTVVLEAAWAATSPEGSSSGNNVILTLSGTPPAGHIVILGASNVDETSAIAILSSTYTWNTIAGPINSAGFNIRQYIFCAVADGVDSTFEIDTTGATVARAYAKAFSGGTCTLDGAVQTNDDATSPYNLTTQVSNAGSDSLVIGCIRSDSAADFNPGTDFTQFGVDTDPGSCEYRITTASGNYDTPWTSAAAENALMVSLSLTAAAEAGGGASRMLLGLVGEPQ